MYFKNKTLSQSNVSQTHPTQNKIINVKYEPNINFDICNTLYKYCQCCQQSTRNVKRC